MHDLRLALFYSYIAYSISLPGIFCFLLFIYRSFSHFLVPLVIVDTVLTVGLLIILRWFRAGEARPWLYLLLITVTTFITVRHMFVFISVLYRTFNDFERRRAIFLDAVDRRIDLLQQPEHPVWPLILAKQCCGTNSESMQSRSNEYRWFTQTPFAYFCPGFEVNHVAVIHFEKTFKTKYSPRGPCLPILDSELKIELILISIDLGFGVFLVLLTWLFISQDRRKYSAYFRKISENEMTRKNRDVVVGPMSIVPQPTLVIDDVDLPIQIIATKPPTKKHTYKGYLNGLNETQ